MDAPSKRDGVIAFGGLGFLAAASLFLTNSVLEFVAGPPPSDGAAILDWRDANFLPLALTSEIMFFATGALLPGVVSLYRGIAPAHPKSGVLGCGLIALTLPIFAVLLIVHGRLVFPVFDIRAHTPDQAELLVALYFGGLHVVWLLFAFGTLALGLGLWKTDRGMAILSFVTAVADALASYPMTIGPAAAVACATVFAAWLAAMGIWLWRRPLGMVPPLLHRSE